MEDFGFEKPGSSGTAFFHGKDGSVMPAAYQTGRAILYIKLQPCHRQKNKIAI